MSSISVVKQFIKPWCPEGGQPRYYVNDWVNRIYSQLEDYTKTHHDCPPIESISRWAKVWYDGNGIVHVDGLYDLSLTNFIADTMGKTQFLDADQDSKNGKIEVPWAELIDDVPRRDEGFAAVFSMNGREFWVDMEFLAHEKYRNKAYILEDGTHVFESESSHLTELVLELMNQYESSNPKSESADFMPFIVDIPIESSYQSTKQRDGRKWIENAEPTFATTSDLFPDDPERERVIKASNKTKVKQKKVDHEDVIQQHKLDFDLEKEIRKQAKETRLPMSRWTKAVIIETCEGAGIPEKSMDIIKGMTLKGIQTRFLVYDGTDVTGNDYDSSQQRHTKFWRLDIDAIRSL